ncbi:MAG: hypothetical protein ABIL24_08345 [candidate division WOR-3 bacterium]
MFSKGAMISEITKYIIPIRKTFAEISKLNDLIADTIGVEAINIG